MKRTIVIFNPAACGGKTRRAYSFLRTKTNNTFPVSLVLTERPGDAQGLAAQAIADGYELIVAAGGDGTVNEVVNGIGLSGVSLGLLHVGTTNLLAHGLGIPVKFDRAWELLARGAVRRIDLGCAEATGARRYFVQLAGVGLDAARVQNARLGLKKKIGAVSYVWDGLKAVRTQRPDVEVTFEGLARSGTFEVSKTNTVGSGPDASANRGVLVAIGNGCYFARGLPMFPRARMDDGLLDVCIFQKGGYFHAFRYLQGVMRGVHTGFRDVRYFQTAQLQCSALSGTSFEVDGEFAGDAPVQFSVIPRALQVVV